MNYNRILKLQEEIAKIESDIIQQETVNFKIQKQLESKLLLKEGSFYYQNQNLKANISLLSDEIDKEEKQLNSIQNQLEHDYKFAKDRLNIVLKLISNLQKNVNKVSFDKLSFCQGQEQKLCVGKQHNLEENTRKCRSQLLSQISKIANLSPTTIFNLDLTKVLTNPERSSDWGSQLPPEQLSVLLEYINHILDVFILYYNIPIARYNVNNVDGIICDLLTSNTYKMIETNYMLYKKEQTLSTAVNCLDSICGLLLIKPGEFTTETTTTQSEYGHLLRSLSLVCKSK